MFTLKSVDMIRDPIHHYIEITSIEKAIIDTPWFQRLRYIKQTPTVSFVYPGSNYTRFEHCLGVMHVAGLWAEYLINIKNEGYDNRELVKKDIQKIRLAGLLHDIGHGPFSHVFELNFLNDLGKEAINHEILGIRIIEESMKKILLDKEKKFGLDLNDKDIEDIKDMILGVSEEKDNKFLFSIVAHKGSIDADKIDFLLRDAHHSGASEFGAIDAQRFILSSRLGPENEIVYDKRSFYNHQHFWLARAHMYRNLYFHRTAIAFGIFLGRILKEVEKKHKIIDKIEMDLSYYQGLTDSTFIELYKNDDNIKPLIERLSNRKVPKEIYIEEHSVEYQLIAKTLARRKKEVLKRIKKDLQKKGIDRDILNGLYFEVSHIDIPAPTGECKWIDEEGNLLEKDPSTFLDILEDLSLVFIRVFSWDKIDKAERDEMKISIAKSINSWMREEGLSKGSGKPDLNY